MNQIKNGYEYLQENVIIHRDLKLENFFLHSKESLFIKIGDFGSCRQAEYFQTIVGTTLYQPPEITLGD